MGSGWDMRQRVCESQFIRYDGEDNALLVPSFMLGQIEIKKVIHQTLPLNA